MNINKIPIHDVLTCDAESSVKEIAEKMKEHKDRRIFVVDGDKKLKGIVTTVDLVYKGICGDSGNMKAKDIMSANVKSVDISEDIEKALEIMNELKIYNCPVTENGRLVGIISYHDVVGHVLKEVE